MSWPKRRLGDFMEFRNGLSYSAADRGDGLAIVGVADVSRGGRLPAAGFETIREPGNLPDAALLWPGDLLFVRSNGSRDLVGRCAEVGPLNQPTTHSGFTIRARVVDSEVNPKWVAAFFACGMGNAALGRGARGTNISNLRQERLQGISIPCPPRALQDHYAAVIDLLEDQIQCVEDLIRIRNKQLTKLRSQLLGRVLRLRQFHEPWIERPIRTLLAQCDAGDWGEDPVPDDPWAVVRAGDIRPNGSLDMSNVVPRNVPHAKRPRLRLLRNDIVLERSGGSNDRPVGRVAIVSEDADACVTNFLHRLRADEPLIRPRFLFHCLMHFHCSGHTNRLQTQTTGIRNLMFERYMDRCLAIPPLPEQNAIAEVLDRAWEVVDQLEQLRNQYAVQCRWVTRALFEGQHTANGYPRSIAECAT
jgi:hypothetical protein